MWYARDRSLLQLHLPEGWPSPAAIDANFRYARFEGGSFVTGVAPLAAVPSATTAIAVAPASAVLFVRVTLPKVRGNKLARLLPLAVEDAIATPPEEAHVVLVEHVPAGSSLVAVVNREWLAAAVSELAAHSVKPSRCLVETELAAHLGATEATHPWVVVCSDSGGFAFLGEGEITALDLGEGASNLPLALRLARNTHRRRGETPDEILVFTSPGSNPPDLEAWSRALDVPVRNGGEWRPELVDSRALRVTDLLRGDFGPTWGARDFATTLKVAGIAAATVLGVHALLTIGDWWRLSSEARQLTTQMETQFRQIFPDAQVVVDAPLQMRRSLARLRRDAGVPDASDFVPLLAAVGPSLAAAGAHTERVRYERGELELEVTLPASEGREALERRLVVPGYRIRFEQKADASSSAVLVLRVSAGA